MLPDTITLAVDLLNNGTTSDQAFTKLDIYQNRTVYKGPSNSLISKDTLTFYRTFPKKTGNFNGVAKSAVKFTVDTSVAGVDASTTLVAPQIGEISFSLPVGFTAAQAKVLRQRMIALLDNDTIMAQAMEGLEV